MDFKWLKTFITVFEEGNFRIAAEKLYISQPSVTVHIQALEEELETKLFIRNHTQLKLTAEGHFFYPLAKEIVTKVQESKKELQLYAQQQKKKIVIAFSPMLLSTKLPKIIHNFMEEYPNYEIEILIEESFELLQAMHLNKIDVAIGTQSSSYKDIHAERILSTTLDLIYPSSANLPDENVHQILNYLFSNYPLFTGYFKEMEPILAAVENEYKINRKNNIQDSMFAIALIKDGLGIGLLPEFLVEEELLVGKLKRIDLGAIAKIYPIEIYMKHLRDEESLIPLLTYIRKRFV